jgi:hypothetical protein
MTKYKTFEEWMRKVDAIVEHIAGCSVYDLDDYCFRDAYEEGCSPGNVASKALRNAGY